MFLLGSIYTSSFCAQNTPNKDRAVLENHLRKINTAVGDLESTLTKRTNHLQKLKKILQIQSHLGRQDLAKKIKKRIELRLEQFNQIIALYQSKKIEQASLLKKIAALQQKSSPPAQEPIQPIVQQHKEEIPPSPPMPKAPENVALPTSKEEPITAPSPSTPTNESLQYLGKELNGLQVNYVGRVTFAGLGKGAIISHIQSTTNVPSFQAEGKAYAILPPDKIQSGNEDLLLHEGDYIGFSRFLKARNLAVENANQYNAHMVVRYEKLPH